jgi:hypothetical protein
MVQLLNIERDNEGQVMPVSTQNCRCKCMEHTLVQRDAKTSCQQSTRPSTEQANKPENEGG